MTMMNTLVCQKPTQLVYQKKSIPTPNTNEVVIKVLTVGICGTDIHAWSGNQPFFSYPRVLGHEICGEIVSLGSKVNQWVIGQRVAVIPYISCNKCGACKSGKTNCCENISVIGVHQDGGFCEFLSVPENNLIVVDDVDPEAAALIEPFAISAHAVRRASIITGDELLVVGAGPIGLGVAAIAKADGAKVVVADTSEQRRAHVEKVLGLPTLNPANEDFDGKLRSYFSGMLAAKIIDATGNSNSMNNTVNLIRHGGSITFVGLFKGELQISDPEFHKKETTMMGSRNATKEDFIKVSGLMAQKKITANMMLSHRYDFNRLADNYESQVINNKSLIKGVISFNK